MASVLFSEGPESDFELRLPTIYGYIDKANRILKPKETRQQLKARLSKDDSPIPYIGYTGSRVPLQQLEQE